MSSKKRKEPPIDEKQPILRHLFHTAEWSDLKIETATKTFNVHKAIVCPTSQFLHAACTSGFQETKSGHIKVEEDAQVMKMLVQHMYELELSHLSFSTWDRSHAKNETPSTTSPLIDERRETHLELLLSVIRAADKYDLPSLIGVATPKFEECLLKVDSLDRIARIALLAFGDDMPALQPLRESTICAVRPKLLSLAKDDAAWKLLHSNETLIRMIMTAAAEEQMRH